MGLLHVRNLVGSLGQHRFNGLQEIRDEVDVLVNALHCTSFELSCVLVNFRVCRICGHYSLDIVIALLERGRGRMSVRDKDNVICHSLSHHYTSLQPVLKVLQLGVNVPLCFGHTSRTRLDTTLDRFYARGLVITAFGSTQVHIHLKGG